MKEINDNVFGKLTYDVSYEKYETKILLGKEAEYRIVVVAYEGQEILDVQREAYKTYLDNEALYMEKIPQLLLDYYLDIYDDILEFCDMPKKYDKKHINTKTILDLMAIQTIIFDREGNFGYLCDVGWDDDNGIAIILSGDEITIGEEDELI